MGSKGCGGREGSSVREGKGEWDTAAGLVGLSLRKPAKCKRLTAKTRGQSLSVSRYRAQTIVSQPLNAGSRSLTPTRPCRCIPRPLSLSLTHYVPGASASLTSMAQIKRKIPGKNSSIILYARYYI